MNIKFENRIVEISEIHADSGYIIRVYPSGDILLFEVTETAEKDRYVQDCHTIIEAIDIGQSWT